MRVIALKLDPVHRSVVSAGGEMARPVCHVPDAGGVIRRGGCEPPARMIELGPENGLFVSENVINDRALVQDRAQSKAVRRRRTRFVVIEPRALRRTTVMLPSSPRRR